jgi:penicillin-binding protein 2
MARPQHYFDWHALVREQSDSELVEGTRHRLRWILALFALAAALILGRAAQLEITDGDTFRRLAAIPRERARSTPARRGQIVARDGTILATDRQVPALAIQFRYLQRPLDAEWLRRTARARLPRDKRGQPRQVAAVEERIRAEVSGMHRRLAALCGVSETDWEARTERIDRRVTALAARVDRQRQTRYIDQEMELTADGPGELSAAAILAGLFAPPEPLPPPPVVLAEQTAFHPIVDDPPAELAAEIKRHPAAFPGAKIVHYQRRDYPAASLAAHIVGHVSPQAGVYLRSDRAEPAASDGEVVGLMGIERQFENRLQGRPGVQIESSNVRGAVLGTRNERPAVDGADVILTLDARLQASAEQLLDRGLRQVAKRQESAEAVGGAAMVMDITSGEILAAASAPRFDPNWFARGDARVGGPLDDARRPLFDRVTKMAIPPGSVFKPLVALALVESRVVDPQAAFRCQGYWEDPDRLRCQIFRQHGVGHGDVNLADALAQSCNVYFFDHVTRLGAQPLVDWSTRFGFGAKTNVELPDEAPGHLPRAADLRQMSQTQMLAIGQASLTATPLQVARLYAAIANGGYLVTPKFTRAAVEFAVESAGAPVGAETSRQATDRVRVDRLGDATIRAVAEGLHRAVNDPSGTAFDSARLPWPSVAGKTGTAETGGAGEDHAWFAGYAPAEDPRFVFVVALEHGGSGSRASAVAKAIVQRMQELGYFGAPQLTEKPIPPGKG